MAWGFERGRVYNRRADIHAPYGGQQQGGIITPARHRLVIIITGEEGLAHGYADRQLPNGLFEYFGEGQVGPMALTKGNAAIANHVANGKDLLLFRKLKTGLRFEGEMVCAGYHIEQAPDRLENMRDALVFELLPLEALEEATDQTEPETVSGGLDDLRKLAMAAVQLEPGRKEAKSTIIERSRHVRDYVVARAQGHCEGCRQPAPFLRPNGVPYIEPHHIRRLSDGGPDDPRFVIGLCPNCHRRVHSGADGDDYNRQLMNLMSSIEPN